MTDNKKTHTDESGNTTPNEAFNLAELKKLAKLMGVAGQRDWGVLEYVEAIKAIQEANKYTHESPDNDLQPGYARIIIHRDPTPGHANSSLPVSLNGRLLQIPRGTPQVVPIEYVGVLADAKYTVVVQKEPPSAGKPNGVVVEETILSYPFQVLAERPHTADSQFKSQYDQRGVMYKRKVAFRDAIGKWPTTAELIEWETGFKASGR